MANRAPVISREQVVAYRLDAQGLRERADASRMVTVARAICVQNTPPGAAGQALAARVDGICEADVVTALQEDKSLLQAFAARAAPHVFATADAVVFTRGLLPHDEATLRAFMLGAQPALDCVGITATELIQLTERAMEQVLDGAGLVKDDLGRAVGEMLTDRVPRAARQAWTSPSSYASRQFLGESLVRFALPVLSMRGTLCHGDRRGRSPVLYRTDQWLGADLTRDADTASARADLVERYLRCYGPSTPEHFAEWGGIGDQQALAAWAQVRNDLRQVRCMDATAWIHRADAERLASAPRATGVRLLPPHDPYLQVRDRGTLVADRSLRRRVWRATGSPGAVLVDGQVLATWRPRASGRTLDLRIELLGDLPDRAAGLIREEAERLARHRDRTLGTVDGL
jgi:hypothetical protein